MPSFVNGVPALFSATYLFTLLICALARARHVDAGLAYLPQEVLRSPSSIATTGSMFHASYIAEPPQTEEGMHSGSRRRRLYVEGKEGFHRARRAGESTSVRSSERSNPDTEGSTTTTSSVDEYMDRRGEAKTRLPARRVRGRKGHRSDQSRRVKTSVLDKDSSRLRDSSTQGRKSEGYGKGWKAFWLIGSAVGAGLVLTALGAGIGYRFSQEDSTPPHGDTSLAQRIGHSAYGRLVNGIDLLALVGISYLIKRMTKARTDSADARK